MIPVFSKEIDRTTDEVFEYLKYFSSREVKRVMPDKQIKNIGIRISNSNNSLKIQNDIENEIVVTKYSGYLRSGVITFSLPINLSEFNYKIKEHLIKEIEFVQEFIYLYSLKIGSYHKEINNNRIHNTLIANECGISVPDTLITTSKMELLSFSNLHENIITKPIHNGHLSFELEDKIYNCKGTQLIDEKFIQNLENTFFPSLFQEYINKEMEIRIFFLKNKLYPMAIFSQLDEVTKYDYRNYNNTKPNRNIPFKLESGIEKKIHKFIEKIDLNTGSIDLILTPSNEYYFLEVNPTGQFGWLSTNCNYYISRDIALSLI